MKTRRFGWIVRGFALAAVAFGAMFATMTAQAEPAMPEFATVTVKVADGQEEYGKVSGSTIAKVGAFIALKATPAKGYAFAGWFRESDSALGSGTDGAPVSYVARWKYRVEDRDDQTFVAKFVSAQDDWLQIVSLTQDDAPYEFAQDVTPDVMVGLEGKAGEYSVPLTDVGSLPNGISYVAPGPESIFGTFKGTAKKAGVYYVRFGAANKNGYKHYFTQKWVVGEVDPNGKGMDFDDIGIDWTSDWMRPLTELQTGKACHARPKLELAPKGVVKLEVSPQSHNGLKFLGMDDPNWSITGYPKKYETIPFVFKATYAGGRVKMAQKTVIVKDSGYRYVSVAPAAGHENMGTATKSGVYPVGKYFALTAKPKQRGIYFSGWYFEEKPTPISETAYIDHSIDCATSLGDSFTSSGEYRKESEKLMFYWDIAEQKRVPTVFAKFIMADDDYLEFHTDATEYPELTGEYTFFADPDDDSEEDLFTYDVYSGTLPTVTAKNLPPGITLDTKNCCIVADRSKVKPGMVYPNVTLTAKNLTGKTQTVNLTIRIANFQSAIFPTGNYGIGADGYNLMVGQDVESSDLSIWLDSDTFGTGWQSSVSGIPPGLTHAGILSDDSGSEMVYLKGAPTRAGLYTLTVTLTRGTGQDKETETFTVSINVHDIPSELMGTFNGLTSFSPNGTDPYEGVRPESREVTITVKKDGTIAAKVGKQTFSRNLGHAWQVGEGSDWSYDLYTAAAKENGQSVVYHMHIDATEDAKAFGEYGFTGNIEKIAIDAAGNQTATSVEDGLFYTFQNVLTTDKTLAPFVSDMAKQTSKGIGFEAVEDTTYNDGPMGREKYNLKPTLDSKKAQVKVKVSAKGVATIAGKVGGQTVNCSTTLYPVYDEDEMSMTFYGRVPTTVNKRPALVWINLGFWPDPDDNGKHKLTELMGTVHIR